MQRTPATFLTSTSEGKIFSGRLVCRGLISLYAADQTGATPTSVTLEDVSVLNSLPLPPGTLATLPQPSSCSFSFATRRVSNPARVHNLEEFVQRDLSPCICPVAFEDLGELLLAGPVLPLPEAGSNLAFSLHLSNAMAAFEHYADEELKRTTRPFAFILAPLDEPTKILYGDSGNHGVFTTSEPQPSSLIPLLLFTRSQEAAGLREAAGREQAISALQYLGTNRTKLTPYELFLKV
jgi:hypothetical protein